MAEVQKKGIGGKPVRYGTTANAQATAGSTTNCIATGGSPGTAIPERRANPDVLDRAAVSGSATRLTTANAPVEPAVYAIPDSRKRNPYNRAARAGPATTTARYPVPSTGTDAATARMDGKQWMQPARHNRTGGRRTMRAISRQLQEAAMYNFDKDCEDDREMLREDPYAEYPDFPKECRMTDMAQMDMVYC